MWYCKKLFQMIIKDPLVWASYIILAVVLTIPLFLNADVYGMSYARAYETGNEYDSLCKKAGAYQKDARTSEEFLDISRQIDLLGDVNISAVPPTFFEKYDLYHEYMLKRFDVGREAKYGYSYYGAHKALQISSANWIERRFMIQKANFRPSMRFPRRCTTHLITFVSCPL